MEIPDKIILEDILDMDEMELDEEDEIVSDNDACGHTILRQSASSSIVNTFDLQLGERREFVVPMML